METLAKSRMEMLLVMVAASTALFAQSSGPGNPQNHASVLDAREIVGPSVMATERGWFVEVKIRSGELPALKLCRHYTILKQDMDAFLDRHRAALLDKHRSALTQSAKDAA